jgi:hypothetical protein
MSLDLPPNWVSTLDSEKYVFLERCIAAIKKRGVRAEATGGFSIFVGKGKTRELPLEEY